MIFSVASLGQRQSYYFPSAIEVILKNVGKIDWNQTRARQQKRKPCAYFMGCTSCQFSTNWTEFTNSTVHLFHIPQCTIQNRNVQISVLNGAMWDMEQMHCGICEIGLFISICWATGVCQFVTCSYIWDVIDLVVYNYVYNLWRMVKSVCTG